METRLVAAYIAAMQADREKLEAELAFWVTSVLRYQDGELVEIEGGRRVDRSMVRVWKQRIVQIRRQLKALSNHSPAGRAETPLRGRA